MAKGKKTGGRKKGIPNKVTASVKEALTEAFGGAGGVEALTRFAKGYPAAFYALWSKLLPTEINAAITTLGGPELTEVVIVHHKPPPAINDTPSGDGAIADGQDSTSPEHAPRAIEGVGV